MIFKNLIKILFLCLIQILLKISAIDVQNLLNRMKNEDKCGQMTQIVLGLVTKDGNDPTYIQNPVDINKLRKTLKDYKIGSILGIPSLNVTISQNAIKQIQDVAMNETAFSIPIIYGEK